MEILRPLGVVISTIVEIIASRTVISTIVEMSLRRNAIISAMVDSMASQLFLET